MLDDFDAGYKAGYNKAYTEMYDFISTKLKENVSPIDEMYGRPSGSYDFKNQQVGPIQGAKGIDYATGPTGYVPNYGVSGVQEITNPTSWNVYDDNGNIVGVQGVVNAYDHNYRRYM